MRHNEYLEVFFDRLNPVNYHYQIPNEAVEYLIESHIVDKYP